MNKRLLIFATISIVSVGALIFFLPIKKDRSNLLSLAPGGVVSENINRQPTAESPNLVPSVHKDNNQTNIKMSTSHLITLKTSLGDIIFKTYDEDAPKTVNNFITLVQKDFYNSIIFHRVIDGFMIQGGDPTGTGAGGPGYAFEDELNPNTDSYKKGYKKGTVAMANAGPNTNGSQFFIMVADYPLPYNYTIFGSVVSGQDVADQISLVPRSGADKPLTPVFINKVIIEDAPQS